MRDLVRKAVIAATAVIAITATTVAVPTSAEARWGGGFHGGGFHGGGWHGGGHWRGGGWGLGAAGLAIGTGIALAATAPYAYGGYYDDDYYAYPRYTYGYGYPIYRRAYYPAYRRVYYGAYPAYRRAVYAPVYRRAVYAPAYRRAVYAGYGPDAYRFNRPYVRGAVAHRPYVRAAAYRRIR